MNFDEKISVKVESVGVLVIKKFKSFDQLWVNQNLGNIQTGEESSWNSF